MKHTGTHDMFSTSCFHVFVGPTHHPSGSGGADGGNVDEKYALFEKWRADGVPIGPEAYKVMMWSLLKRAPSDPTYLQRAHAVLGKCQPAAKMPFQSCFCTRELRANYCRQHHPP